jgi:hypothetical protein
MVKGLCEKDFLRKPFTILIGALQVEDVLPSFQLNTSILWQGKCVFPVRAVSLTNATINPASE